MYTLLHRYEFQNAAKVRQAFSHFAVVFSKFHVFLAMIVQIEPILMIFTSTDYEHTINLYFYSFITVFRSLLMKKTLSHPLFFYLMLRETS